MNSKQKLTKAKQDEICKSIREGAYPAVAAAAAGIPIWLWEKWHEWKHRKRYAEFWEAVHQAEAQARMKAEIAAADNDPKFWLKSGPGKETPLKAGWTSVVRPQLTHNTQTINLFTSPDFLRFMAMIRQALAPYPQALAALAMAIDKEEHDDNDIIEANSEPNDNPRCSKVGKDVVCGAGDEPDIPVHPW